MTTALAIFNAAIWTWNIAQIVAYVVGGLVG